MDSSYNSQDIVSVVQRHGQKQHTAKLMQRSHFSFNQRPQSTKKKTKKRPNQQIKTIWILFT
jgi:hypothetical protein